MKFAKTTLIFSLFLTLVACTETTPSRPATTQSSDTTAHTIDRYVAVSQKIKEEPNNPALYFERSKVLFDSLELADAMGDIDRALLLDSNNAEFRLHKADIYYRQNKTRLSKEQLEKILALDKDNLEANLRMAEIFHIVGNFKKSIEYVNEVLRIDVYNPTAYYWKGLNYKMIGDTATAVSSFQTAREQNNDFFQAYIQLGLLYGSVNDDQAIAYYDNAIRIQPNSYDAHYNKAIYLQENNYPEQALGEYQILIKIGGAKLPQIYHNIGYVNLIYLEDFPAAIEAFDQALALFPEYIEARHNRGLTHESMGNAEAAVKDYRMVLKMQPDYTKSALGLERLLD
ncbi:MAG: tetratricopeptide repeat protein [Salibacteraceae bacterium]